jgi:hypothetical protein
MSVSLVVTISVLLSLALIGGLAYVMSLPRLLTPHVSGAKAAISPEEAPRMRVSRLPRPPCADAEPVRTTGAAA